MKSTGKSRKNLVFQNEYELDSLISAAAGVAIGLVVISDRKVIEEGNCFSTKKVINSIIKILKNVNLSLTSVSVKIGIVFRSTSNCSKAQMMSCRLK